MAPPRLGPCHDHRLTHRRAKVIVDGGILEIEWRDDGHALMTGPVVTAFTGEAVAASSRATTLSPVVR